MPAHDPPRRVALVVPDLGLADVPLTVSLWLVPVGSVVAAGDRVVELVAGGATIDLEAPVTGRLVTLLVDEDDAVDAGRKIAEFEVPA
jgi:pyruvate/2-oxoglutarate dehydrogenase complex dihydrolipoamide acyltransferase (E2) component